MYVVCGVVGGGEEEKRKEKVLWKNQLKSLSFEWLVVGGRRANSRAGHVKLMINVKRNLFEFRIPFQTTSTTTATTSTTKKRRTRRRRTSKNLATKHTTHLSLAI